MEQIKTTDCYLPATRASKYRLIDYTDYTKGWLDKHEGMIVLTKEQYLDNIKDAMNYMCTPREYLESIENLLK